MKTNWWIILTSKGIISLKQALKGLCIPAGICILGDIVRREGGGRRGVGQGIGQVMRAAPIRPDCPTLFALIHSHSKKGLKRTCLFVSRVGSRQAGLQSCHLPSLPNPRQTLPPVYRGLISAITVGFSASTFMVCPHHTLFLTTSLCCQAVQAHLYRQLPHDSRWLHRVWLLASVNYWLFQAVQLRGTPSPPPILPTFKWIFTETGHWREAENMYQLSEASNWFLFSPNPFKCDMCLN